ncbi:MAG: DUF6440 family protein [Endomicrobiaceae bacterium]|nr:DUF6440 family protein [Endomicrobiaceae bacterium]
MKRFKLIFICMIVLMLLLCFSAGCITEDDHILNEFNFNIKVFVDPETGVNYLVHSTDGSLNERYNADGTLFVSEVVK